VRILFAFAGSSGHAQPLVPLAAAATAAGHSVAFAGRPAALESLAAAGYAVFATEPPRTRPRRRIPLQGVDLAREQRDFRDGFADRLAREKVGAMLPLCAEWRPDAIVCDETDFGSLIAAERTGLPCAAVVVTAARSFAVPELVASPLDRIRAEHGLPPDPELESLTRRLRLVPFPLSFRDPASPLPEKARAFRPVARRAPEPDATTVYFTLGTEFNVESGDLFTRVLAGLRELPFHVVCTVGPDIDPAELGSQPDRIRVERYVPQGEILPRASLVVCHGGSGTVLGALAHGLPMVLLPMGADQPYNAARCEALGLARSLDVVAATSQDIRDAVESVLSEPGYRRAAQRLRDDFASLPGPDCAVEWVVADASGGV
jgi:UDP:flavonoid glycosyltransferase YjiC (YdhE family)